MVNRLPALIIAALGFVLYASTSYPFPDWLDSPELMTAAFRLGVFHPPGSPLAVILGHLFSLWPCAGPATSLLYFSAFFAGCALYVLARSVQVLWRSLGPRGKLLEAAVVSGLSAAFALSFGLWSQAVRTEVYTLGLFLFLCALREFVHVASEKDERNPQRVIRAAAFCGMGLCVHPLMALSVAPGIALLAALKSTRGLFITPRHLVRSAAAFLLGAAPLLFLPLLTRTPVDLRFGDATTVGGFFEAVLGLTFSHSFLGSQTSAGGMKALAVIVLGAGIGLAVLAALGLYPLIRKKPAAALLLLLTGVTSALALALQRSVRLDNPDTFGYALPAMAAVCLLAAGGLSVGARLLSELKEKLAWVAPALALLALAATVLAADWKRMDRSGCDAGRRLAVSALRLLDKNTVVIVSDFNLAFMFEYLIHVEGLRPDVRVLYLRDLDNRALRKALAESDPGLEKLLPAADGLDRDSLSRLSDSRPVALDAGPHLETGLVARGLLCPVRADEPPPENRLVCEARSFYSNLQPPLCKGGAPDPRTRDVVAWHAYWQSRAAEKLGLPDLSRTLLDVARRMSLDDQTIADAVRRLGPPPSVECESSPESSTPATPSRRPPVLPAFLLLLGLLAWALPLSAPGSRTARIQLRLAIGLSGLFCMAAVLWLV